MYGQLGDGSTGHHRYTPVQVQGLSSVIAVAAGMVIVWHSKATEPSGRGEIMTMANSAMENDKPLYSRSTAGSRFGCRHRCGPCA